MRYSASRLRTTYRSQHWRAQGTPFAFVVGRRVKDNRCCGEEWHLPPALHELVAVHRRHQDVADDGMRLDLQRRVQRFPTVRGLDDAVTAGEKNGAEEFAVERLIFDIKTVAIGSIARETQLQHGRSRPAIPSTEI